jgi:hypothetical protein
MSDLTQNQRDELRNDAHWYGANVIDNMNVNPDTILALLDERDQLAADLFVERALVDELHAQRDALRTAAQTLLDLKRGPRDSPYYARKQGAWDALAVALGGDPQ